MQVDAYMILTMVPMMSAFYHFAPFYSSRKLPMRPSTQLNLIHKTSNTTSSTIVPRAAVSVVLRWSKASSTKPSTDMSARYLLVQRGNEPNMGMWSLPGGKIEPGENTIQAARRELMEETGLGTIAEDTNSWTLKWHAPFACSDSIHHSQSGDVLFHYVISQCFAELRSVTPPKINASDDALDAKFWSFDEVKDAEIRGVVTKGVASVIQRSEKLHSAGLLDCDDSF